MQPTLYNLSIEALTDLENFTFSGSLSVDVLVRRPGVNTVTCHAVDLKIEASSVRFEAGGRTFPAASVSFDAKLETVTFTFDGALPEGAGCLIVSSYIGELNDKMKGFYRSKYQVDGKQKYMAVTQFEATDARRCLPCWDEPAVKAEFECTIRAPSGQTVVSNMPLKKGFPSDSKGGSLTEWSFERTPRMSTYLLAFVVGEFEFIEAKSRAMRFEEGKACGDVRIRVYAPKGRTDQATFALDVAVKCLNYYTEFFEIGYPLPKLDLIAIPDFSAGAMENWGCVTYRTVCLLVDEKNTSLSNKQYVAIVVAHELAHQWFGNLVTMEWWTELWLNEGFASWVEYLAVDKLFPEWKVWQKFINDAHNPALKLDSLLSSHPIEVPVQHPSEIDEIFDAISYLKGAAVIRMLANYLGTETFRKGLVAYLSKFKYSNARTVDLWRFLEIGGGLRQGQVSQLMTNWTGKMGYPLVTVDEKDGALVVSQKHFVSSGSGNADTLWQVPVSLDVYAAGAKEAKTQQFVLKGQSETVEYAASAGTAPAVLANPDSRAYFIVSYGPALFARLTALIRAGKVDNPIDRLAIQQDLLSVVKSGVDKGSTSKEFFELLQSFADEDDSTVWESILSNLGQVSTLVKAAGLRKPFSRYVVGLLSKIAGKVGWDAKEGETPQTKALRARIIPLIGAHGEEKTVKRALSAFDAFYENKEYTPGFKGESSLSPDLRSGVYRIAVKQRGAAAFDQLLEIYKATPLQEERVRVLRSLGANSDPALVQRALDLAFDFETVRKQDFMYLVYGSAGTAKGLRVAWAFLKKQWGRILKEFKGSSMIARLVSITAGFASEDDRKDVDAFFKANDHAGAERKVSQCLESIAANTKWLARDRQAIAQAIGAAE